MALKVINDVNYLVERLSTPEEKELFGRKYVIDTVSIDDVRTLDSSQDYVFIAGIPKEVPFKEGPVKNVRELTHDEKIKDELELALFDEMKKIILDTYRVKYQTRDNKEEIVPLLPSIQKAFSNYLYEYASIRKGEDVLHLDANDMYWVIFALADIVNRDKLGDTFVKLQQEGEIRWIDRGKKGKAQMLAYRKLSKYIPSKPGWELPKFESFHDFHEDISDLIHNSIEKYQGGEQPTLILEMAYEILESKREKMGWPEKFYPQKEIPWYAKH